MILLAAILTLEAESLALLLDRYLPAEAEYIVFDPQSRTIAKARWPDPDAPIPLGSLQKPMIALDYARRHGAQYPVLTCRAGCWSPRPHGRLDLPHALSISCNNYFQTLMEGSVPERLGPAALLGWYSELVVRAAEPGVSPILRGLALAAEAGTARGIGRGALAKTGTGPCTHSRRGSGDGFVVALTPATRPRVAVMVRLHDRPGSQAAIECGRVLARWRGSR